MPWPKLVIESAGESGKAIGPLHVHLFLCARIARGWQCTISSALPARGISVIWHTVQIENGRFMLFRVALQVYFWWGLMLLNSSKIVASFMLCFHSAGTPAQDEE